jgi:CRP-like cAMP-binding protein
MTVNYALDNVKNTRRNGPFSLKLLFASFPERTAKKGETLINRNHSLGYVFYLVSGMIKTLNYYPEKDKELVNGYFTSGDLMNLDLGFKHNANPTTLKVASTKATFKVIPINQFKDLIYENPGLNQLVLATLTERLNKNNNRLHRLLLYKSRQRVIQFLLDYVAEVGQRVGYEFVIKRPFTHEEMGNLSDTSRQTVTTVLNELKSANIIHFTRRYIVIRNMDSLVEELKSEAIVG